MLDIIVMLTGSECRALGLHREGERRVPVELSADGGGMIRRGDEMTRAVPNPCPFCGNENPQVGHEDAHRMSVSCGCGARMIVPCPDEFPEGIDTIEYLDRATALVALARWNMGAGAPTA